MWSGFQSTLPRGERPSIRFMVASVPCRFNPRSHAGSDKGARYYLRFQGSFNPRSHAGSDERFFTFYASDHVFQSTLPRGERLAVCSRSRAPVCFNPRSHAGSDIDMMTFLVCHPVFQSTLPRGERLVLRPRTALGLEVSIHAPTRGATLT